MDRSQQKRPRESRTPRRKKAGPGVIFLTALALMTVFAWCLPLRPAVSEGEKRELEKFPAFSLSSLADGSYFNQIGLWFSDTFPGRDHWIGADQAIKNLYGRRDVVIYGTVDTAEEEPTASPVPAAKPAAAPMDAGEPAEEPTVTPEPEPEITPEPEPEDEWGGKVIEDEDLVTVGAVIQIGDSAFSFTGFSPYYSDLYAANINRAAELLRGRARVSSVFVLHSTTLLLPRDYRESIGSKPEEDALAYINGQLADDVIAVDTYNALLPHNGEYIYFRTDHHWTALGAWYVYAEWARMAGFEPVGLDQYTEYAFEPFYGTLFYKANQSRALLADTVYAYEPPGDVHLYLEVNGRDSLTNLGYEQPLITQVRGSDKYLCFLSGDLPMATFVNNDITDGSACVIIKNSNGNPYCYYYTQHYQYVYVLDYRKYTHRKLVAFVDYYGVQDVIFCLSSGQAQSQGGNDLLKAFIR